MKTKEQSLEDFADHKISFERLAEELEINFYPLHRAFLSFRKPWEPTSEDIMKTVNSLEKE